jgi:glycosyltransferase involved in cell wall biosynthesis
MWNEQEYIGRTLAAAHEACAMLIDIGEIADYEVIIVDDASTDDTPRLADEAAAADPRVKVVRSRPDSPPPPATSCSTPTPTCRSTWVN